MSVYFKKLILVRDVCIFIKHPPIEIKYIFYTLNGQYLWYNTPQVSLNWHWWGFLHEYANEDPSESCYFVVYRDTVGDGQHFDSLATLIYPTYTIDTFYVDTSVPSGKKVRYKIKMKGKFVTSSGGAEERECWSNMIKVKTISAPYALNASPYEDKVIVSWQHPGGADGYEILREEEFGAEDSGYVLLDYVTGYGYTDTLVEQNHTYHYKVASFYRDRSSAISTDSVTVTTPWLNVPTYLTTPGLTYASIPLSWDDNSAYETGI